jgi:HEPN domain-containing protein
MSNLATHNGDDHPEAAKKHLFDAKALVNSGRTDGAAYLAGYVIECSLKALLFFEHGVAGGSGLAWGHSLTQLQSAVSTTIAAAGAKAARYIGTNIRNLSSAAIMAWDPAMRYRAPSVSNAQATSWVDEAQLVYDETVGQMMLDGVI